MTEPASEPPKTAAEAPEPAGPAPSTVADVKAVLTAAGLTMDITETYPTGIPDAEWT